jgi:hypothetical protein
MPMAAPGRACEKSGGETHTIKTERGESGAEQKAQGSDQQRDDLARAGAWFDAFNRIVAGYVLRQHVV